jgi:hypothetical protein
LFLHVFLTTSPPHFRKNTWVLEQPQPAITHKMLTEITNGDLISCGALKADKVLTSVVTMEDDGPRAVDLEWINVSLLPSRNALPRSALDPRNGIVTHRSRTRIGPLYDPHPAGIFGDRAFQTAAGKKTTPTKAMSTTKPATITKNENLKHAGPTSARRVGCYRGRSVVFYFGGCNSGEVRHLSMFAAVSACRIFFCISYWSAPAGAVSASARSPATNSARRF